MRKCRINNFHETIPPSRILVSLSIIDDMVLKIDDDDVENIFDNFQHLRDIILYILSFRKVSKKDVDKILQYNLYCYLIFACRKKTNLKRLEKLIFTRIKKCNI